MMGVMELTKAEEWNKKWGWGETVDLCMVRVGFTDTGAYHPGQDVSKCTV